MQLSMPPPGDEARIMRLAQTDLQQFAPLYERYFSRIYAYCRRRVASDAEAEDLTSQVFIRALSRLGTYQGGSVAAWLFRIAHNSLANHYRDRRPVASLESVVDDLPADLPETLDLINQAEQFALLDDLLTYLSEEQRDLLALKLEGELSSDEIGEVVGKKSGAVRVELHRIIKRLRHLALERMTDV